MKIGVAQINTTVGDLEGNTSKIISKLKLAKQSGCDLVVFHELTIPGYPPKDLVLQSGFIAENIRCVKKIADTASELGIATLVGFIHTEGDNKYNAVAAIDKDGSFDIVKKFHLPNFNVFDEKRYFTQSEELGVVTICGVKLGIHICEDLWDDKYDVKVVDKLVEFGAKLLINLSASPFEYGKRYERFSLVQSKCNKLKVSMIYVNAVGGQDELIFDGESIAVNPNNDFVLVCNKFREDFKTVVFNEDRLEGTEQSKTPKPYAEITEIHDALVLGIRDYMGKNGFKGALIGLSGGIDSAVVAALAVRAIGASNVIGILMPSQYSSGHSVTDAESLSYNLGMRHYAVSIKNILESYVTGVSPTLFKSHLPKEEGGVSTFRSDVTEQNFQARIRGNILMGFSNDLGYMVLSTGNKSESAVGYCVSKNSLLRTDQGLLYANELSSEFEHGKYSYKKNSIEASWISNKEHICLIKTEIGTTIEVSLDHEEEVFLMDKKRTVFRKASDINIGDILIAEIGENIWGDSTDIEFTFKKKKFDYKSQNISFPKEITEDLATFIGICVADGSYSKNVYRIRTSKVYVSEFCIKFLQTVMRISESSLKVTEPDERGCFYVEICSVQLCDFLEYLGVRHGSHKKDIPSIIRKSPSNIVKAFISGVMLDSTGNENKNRSEVAYHSVSRKLAFEIQQLFLNLGILSFFREKQKNSENPYYEVYIPPYETYKLKSFNILKEKIVSIITNNETFRKRKTSVDFIYPEEKDLLKLKLCLTDRNDLQTVQRAISSCGKIGRNTLSDILEKISDNDNTVKKLISIVNSNTYYIKVTDITIQDNTEEMHDFSVENIHQYNINGFNVHNCTLYGDMSGGLSVIGDTLKTKVYDLAKYINSSGIVIPLNTIKKPASAELKPGQIDQNELPPYEVLDGILSLYIEEAMSPEYIISRGYSEEIVRKVVWMVKKNEYKRRQGAPALIISPRDLNYGRRFPITNRFKD